MGQFFHVLIDIDDNQYVHKFDLREQQLLDRVVGPYNSGRYITIQGTNINPRTMKRLWITTSDEPGESLRQATIDDERNSPVFFMNAPIDRWAVQRGEDVTDDYIQGPPGNDRSVAFNQTSVEPTSADPRRVFVIHGRDDNVKSGVFALLRSVDLAPVEWSEAVAATRQGTPYIGDVLRAGFAMARAAVVILTPDDDVILKERFWSVDEPDYEKQLTGQARPNVLFEAGMAMGMFPDRTVIVETGRLRPFSDVLGRHVIRLDDSVRQRQGLLDRLRTAGCAVVTENRTDWHHAGNLTATGDSNG